MNSTQSLQADVIIVGAGIAGLMAGNWLKENGRAVIILEKEAVIGGRMATKQLENGRADIGAQFFTVREPQFQSYVEQWIDAGVVFEWSRGWADGSMVADNADKYPRYAVNQGMEALCQHLGNPLMIKRQTEVVSISQQQTKWQLLTTNGTTLTSNALILTPPMPISLTLLDRGQVMLTAEDRHQLEQIGFAPCWSSVVEIDGLIDLPPPGVMQRPEATVSWIADNRQKGISQNSTVITMHISPQKSKLWALSPAHEIEGVFRQEIRPFLAKNSVIKKISVHYWPHAIPTTTHPARTLLAQNVPPLVFAGDAFAGPRVEGAALSGLAAAMQINQQIL